MNLTYADVFDRLGINAPFDSFASVFAHAGYNHWEANQTALYNILKSVRAAEDTVRMVQPVGAGG